MGKYDPYQLLELLAFNIKCVCKVYADHLQSIIDKSEGGQIQAKEFITRKLINNLIELKLKPFLKIFPQVAILYFVVFLFISSVIKLNQLEHSVQHQHHW